MSTPKASEILEKHYRTLIASGKARAYVPERDKDLHDVYVVVFTPNHEREIPQLGQRGNWSVERIPYGAMKRRVGPTIGIYTFEGLEKALRELEALGKQYDVLIWREKGKTSLMVEMN